MKHCVFCIVCTTWKEYRQLEMERWQKHTETGFSALHLCSGWVWRCAFGNTERPTQDPKSFAAASHIISCSVWESRELLKNCVWWHWCQISLYRFILGCALNTNFCLRFGWWGVYTDAASIVSPFFAVGSLGRFLASCKGVEFRLLFPTLVTHINLNGAC